MEKSKFRQLLMALLVLVMVVASFGVVACKRNNKESTSENTSESVSTPVVTTLSGDYYCQSATEIYEFSFTDSTFTYDFGHQGNGTYTVTDGNVAFVFAGELNLNVTQATYNAADDKIAMTVGGKDYTFVKGDVYEVSFEANGGTATQPVKVVGGNAVTAPADPSKDGAAFIGWFASENYDVAYDFSAPVTANTTVYAYFVKYESNKQEYTVTVDYGDGKEVVRQTVNGKLYYLGTPVREGYTFKGWYTSDYNDVNKLSRVVDGNTLFIQDDTVYAVWESEDLDGKLAAPIVTIGVEDISWESVDGANNYYVVVTNVANPETPVYSNSRVNGYSVSDVDFSKLPAGEYVIEVRANAANEDNNSVVTTLYYKNNRLATVGNLEVLNNVLIFTAVEGAEEYFISIECGNAQHSHEMLSLGTKLYYDFAGCEMRVGGIKLTVYATAEGRTASKSETVVIENYLDKVEGLKVENDVVVWNDVVGAESYVVEVAYINEDNRSVVDRYDVKTAEFAIDAFVANQYTFTVYAKAAGAVAKDVTTLAHEKNTLVAPTDVKIVENEVTWGAVEGAQGYKVKVGGKEYDATEATFDLTDKLDASVEDYTLEIKAVAAQDAKVSDSVYAAYDIRNLVMASSVKYADGRVYWAHVVGATAYRVTAGGTTVDVTDGSNSLAVQFSATGVNTITVTAIVDGTESAAASVEVSVYKAELYNENKVAYSTVYVAEGDEMKFEVPAKRGYEFAGWYLTEEVGTENGERYPHAYFTGNKNLVLYVDYVAKTYTVILKGIVGEVVGEAQVTYDQKYQLTVPENEDDTMAFEGWYYAGAQLTEQNGQSNAVWAIDENYVELTSSWAVKVLTFTEYNNLGYTVGTSDGVVNVTELTIPQSYKGKKVYRIVGTSFQAATKLKKVNIPNTIEEIATGAFANCLSLEEINVYEVEENKAFRYFTDDGILYDNGIYDEREEGEEYTTTLTFCPASKTGHIDIVDGTDVLAASVFDSRRISSVYIPASVKTIDKHAFYNCVYLEKVEFEMTGDDENAVGLTIGTHAFYGNVFTEINLPKRITKFETGKYYVNGVNVYTTGTSYETKGIGDSFHNCTLLKAVNIEDGSEAYKSINGVVYNSSTTELLYFPTAYEGEYTIPATVHTIANGAFINSTNLLEIKIPATVKTIGECAFYYLPQLASVTFEGGITMETTTIGKYAFRKCKYLKDIVFEADNVVSEIGEGAFYDCSLVKDIVIPATVTAIGKDAFYNCTNLVSVTFEQVENPEESEITFGADVFYGCSILPTIELPAHVRSVPGIFGGCRYLKLVTVNENNPYLYSDENGVIYDKEMTQMFYYSAVNTATEFIVPETVEIIGGGVFRGNNYLKKVTIGKNVTEIGNNAFESCYKLKTVVFEEGSAETLTIGDSAFFYCYALSSIELPARTKSIGKSAFYYTTGCTTLTLNEGLESIGAEAFYNSAIGGTLNIPASLKTIGDKAFYFTSGITAVNFAENSVLEYIGDYGLIGLDITEIVIPASVKTIGIFAFNNSNVTATANNLASVVFEEGSVLESIGAYAFVACKNLKSINLPNTVKSIGVYAFSECTSLETFTVAEGGTEDLVIGELCTYTPASASGRVGWGYTFYNCTSLKTVNLSARATTLGQYTFANCYNLESVLFGGEDETSRLTNIASYAFANCYKLQSISISASLTNLEPVKINSPTSSSNCYRYSLPAIGAYAFQNCTSLQTVYFEEGGTSETAPVTIENNAFNGCSSLTTVTLPSRMAEYQKWQREGYNGNYSSYDTKTVVQPLGGTNVFYGNVKLTAINIHEGDALYKSVDGMLYNLAGDTIVKAPTGVVGKVTIPANVTTIGANAFANCLSLTELEFAASEKDVTIKSGAFSGCSALETINFAENVKTMENNAFANCVSLTTVTVPKNMATFNAGAFSGCKNLEGIQIVEGSENFVVSEDGFALISVDGKTLYFYVPGATVIDYTVPATVEQIAPYAFYNVKTIRKLTIHENVKTIGDYAFYGCTGINEVVFEGTDETSNLNTIGKYAFAYSRGLTEIKLPANVTALGDHAFYGCEYLVTADLNANGKFESLENAVFGGCTQLETVIVPNATKTVKDATSGSNSPFYGTFSLKNIDFGGENSNLEYIGKYFLNYTNIEEVNVPTSVTKMGDYVFAFCYTLKTVNFAQDAKLQSIGRNFFHQCTGLEKILFPDSLTTMSSSGYIINNCNSFDEFKLPANLKEIPSRLFAGSNCGPTSVVIPASVTTIGSNAFNGATNLKSVVFEGNNVTSLPSNVFSGCTALENIVLPDSITSIGSSAFYRTESLKTISIPAGVTKIDSSTFQYSGIESIEFKVNERGISLVNTIGSRAFANCENLKSIELPDTVVSISTNVFTYCTSLERVRFPENGRINAIGNYTFQDCSSLVDVNIPESVTSIGSFAFARSGLQKIVLPEGLKTLSISAFNGCEQLEEVVLPEDFITLSSRAFYGCVNLKKINLPNHKGFTAIPDNVFYGCTSLENLEIPAYVKSIGENAFYGAGLTSIVIPESVNDIGANAFANNKATKVKFYDNLKINTNIFVGNPIETFEIVGDQTTLELKDGVLVDTSANKIIICPVSKSGTYTIPAEIKHIGAFAFSGAVLDELIIPDGVSIANNAFDGCQIGKLTLPSDLEEIPYAVFNNAKVGTLVLPENLLSIAEEAFYGADVGELSIPNTVTSIGRYAFNYLKAETVKFEEGEGYIQLPADLFAYAEISSFEVPARFETLPERIFSNCANLKTVTFAPRTTLMQIGVSAFYRTGLEHLTIPGFVRATSGYAIAERAFEYSTIQTITIEEPLDTNPANAVFNADDRAFVNSGLTSIHFPSDLANGDTVNALGINVFDGAKALEEVTFEPSRDNSTITVGAYLFNNSGLKSFTFPANLVNISNYMFTGTAIEEIVIPETVTLASSEDIDYQGSVTTMAASAVFANCKNLKKITINAKFTSLNSSWFQNCPLLEEVILPEGLKTFSTSTFAGCDALKEITIPASVTTISLNSFSGWGADRVIHIKGEERNFSLGWSAEATVVWDDLEYMKPIQTEEQA